VPATAHRQVMGGDPARFTILRGCRLRFADALASGGRPLQFGDDRR
jgi:hypothetical protein